MPQKIPNARENSPFKEKNARKALRNRAAEGIMHVGVLCLDRQGSEHRAVCGKRKRREHRKMAGSVAIFISGELGYALSL